MTKPDITRPAKAKKREHRDYDEFHETLAAPIPNQSYHDEIELEDDHVSTFEQITRTVATFLGTLLALRFITNLFSSDQTNAAVSLFNGATNWLVQPLQGIFGSAPSTGQGYLDLAAIAAATIIGLVAATIIRIMRPKL